MYYLWGHVLYYVRFDWKSNGLTYTRTSSNPVHDAIAVTADQSYQSAHLFFYRYIDKHKNKI